MIHPNFIEVEQYCKEIKFYFIHNVVLIGVKAAEDEISHNLLLGGTGQNIKMLETMLDILKLLKSFLLLFFFLFPFFFKKMFHHSKLQRVHLICWYVFDSLHQELT